MRNKSLMHLPTFIKHILIVTSFFCISFGQSDPKLMTFDAIDIAENNKEISITFAIPENDFIYKDFITCCVYEPHVTISPWKTQAHSTSYYDPSFKDTKQIFAETFTLSLVATQKEYKAGIIHLYCSYYRSSEKKLNHAIFTFSFPEPIKKTSEPHEIAEDITTTPTRLSLYQPSYIDMYATKLLTCVHKTVAHAQKYYLHYFFLLILCIIALFFGIALSAKKNTISYCFY